MRRTISLIPLLAAILLGIVQASPAAMQAVGPTSGGTGYFPVWYQAGTTKLELCLSKTVSPDPAAAGGTLCTLLPGTGFDPALPIVFPANFPPESFWFAADAAIVDPVKGVDLRYVSAVEAAFDTGFIKNGDQISFTRIRFYVQVPTPGTYTITHPFGVDTFVVTTVDPVLREIQFTRDIGVAPGIFTGALAGDVGPFLVRSLTPGGAPAPITVGGETFIGDPNVLQTVTGSALGTNYVRIVGPGIDLTTNQFALSGKMFGGLLPTAASFDRTTYNRTAAGTVVEVFAKSDPGATATFRETLAPGLERLMTKDPLTGRLYAEYAPAVLPANIVMTASHAGATPTQLSSRVTDLVKITKADYSFAANSLTIEATSSDQVSPVTLTAKGFGALAPVPGSLTKRLVVANLTEPPATVTVTSSAGGTDTEPVVVPYLNIPPVAAADSAVVTAGTVGGVNINVLANDSDPNANLPLTVPAASIVPPASGTVVVNPDNTVTYTPAAGFSGITTFTYQAADSLGALSNAATVTVTVNDIPVAVADAAGTKVGVAATINVLANDTNTVGTLNPASVTVATAPLHGTAVPDAATGAVTYTPAVGYSGTDTFSYTVADSFGAVSAAAAVTVTITANALPVAANDTAQLTAGSPATVNVLANDTDADGTIDPATITIVRLPLSGTATVAAGAVTYTPNAGFPGSDSFTYTVKDNLGAVSNAATVTITATPTGNGLIVLSPNGAESIKRGSPMTVTWSYTGNPGANVTIDLMRGNKKLRTIIAKTPVGTAGSGSYTWPVPATQAPGADYRVRVFVATNVGVTDTSDAFFSIVSAAPAPPPTPTAEVLTLTGTPKMNAKGAAAIANGPQLNVNGKGTPGATIRIFLGPDTTGVPLGAAVVNAGGSWSFAGRVPAVTRPITANTISIQSSLGATVLNKPLQVIQ